MRVMQSVTEVGKYRDFPSSYNRSGAKMRSGNKTTRTQGFSENMAAGSTQPGQEDNEWLCQPALVPSLQPASLLRLTLCLLLIVQVHNW